MADGITCAIRDGDDLLYLVLAYVGNRNVCGVTRWRSSAEGWRPAVFYGMSGGYEPSLVRDTNGSFLYTARDADGDGTSVRVWRSRDGGENWCEVLHDPPLRSNAPMVLNRSPDGTPYLAANHPKGFRNVLAIWPPAAERDRFEPPLVIRGCDVDFGAPPGKASWFAESGGCRCAPSGWPMAQHPLLPRHGLQHEGPGRRDAHAAHRVLY